MNSSLGVDDNNVRYNCLGRHKWSGRWKRVGEACVVGGAVSSYSAAALEATRFTYASSSASSKQLLVSGSVPCVRMDTTKLGVCSATPPSCAAKSREFTPYSAFLASTSPAPGARWQGGDVHQ